MGCHVVVVFHSSTGTIFRAAQAICDGAVEAGAEVRMRRVAEGTAPRRALRRNSELFSAMMALPEPTLDDLDWAHGLVFGTPARFGNVSSQLKGFLDSASPLWRSGRLTDKVVAAFTSASSLHGGQESTLLALLQTMYHWGTLIVPTGCTHPAVDAVGGNPYGLSVLGRSDGSLSEEELAAARYLGRRVSVIAARVAASLPVPS